MEILAEKKRKVAWMYVLLIVLGVLVIAMAAIMLVISLSFIGTTGRIFIIPAVLITGLGVASIVIGIVTLVRIERTPDRITLNGNQVDLGNGLIVNISQITRVDYREARSLYTTYRWGILTVYLENQKINYYYMADVQYARDRMMQLIWQAGNSSGQIF